MQRRWGGRATAADVAVCCLRCCISTLEDWEFVDPRRVVANAVCDDTTFTAATDEAREGRPAWAPLTAAVAAPAAVAAAADDADPTPPADDEERESPGEPFHFSERSRRVARRRCSLCLSTSSRAALLPGELPTDGLPPPLPVANAAQAARTVAHHMSY